MEPVCRELLGIQKTLSHVGPELLGIQEDQKDANFKNREQGRWYKDSESPRYPTKTREFSIKTKPRNMAQRICARSYVKLDRDPCIIIPEIDSVAESAMSEIYRRGMNSKRLQL